MKIGIRSAGAVVLATFILSTPAHAEEGSEFIPWWFTVETGAMLPSGEQGSGLDRGFQGVGTLGYEVAPALVLGGDLGYVSSPDDFRTRILLLGAHGRMSPNPDLAALYVQGGAGLYHIAYHRETAGLSPPPNKIRPGLSFGIGYDVATVSKLSIGVSAMYHGIVVARSDALSYVSLGAYLSLRPGAW
jgi:hypothetical protein